MSYIINNSRGQIVAVVGDGTVNTTATDLALVGRAVTNYGEYQNENYVYILENFAKDTAPPNPMQGQLWYNTSLNTLNFYTVANTWATVGLDTNSNAALVIGNTLSANITTSSLTTVGNSVTLNVSGNLLPVANVTYDIGSASQAWKDLYLSNSTIYFGASPLSGNANGLIYNGNNLVIAEVEFTSQNFRSNLITDFQIDKIHIADMVILIKIYFQG